MLENDIQVRTPEQVRLRLHLAGIGSRAVAQLIDLLILAVVYSLFTVSEVMWQWLNVFGRATSYLVGATVVISFLIFWGYFIALEAALSGQTVGKRVMRIRTVQRDGRPLTFYAATIRNLLRIIDFLPVGYLIGLIVTVIDRQERRIGDFAAGTVVVHDRMHHLWRSYRYDMDSSDFGSLSARDNDANRPAGDDRKALRISVAKVPVSVEIREPLPGEWTQFLIDLGPRLRGLAKAKREVLLPETWSNFTKLEQVHIFHSDGHSRDDLDGHYDAGLGAGGFRPEVVLPDLSLQQIEQLLRAVSKGLRGSRSGSRRGRKTR